MRADNFTVLKVNGTKKDEIKYIGSQLARLVIASHMQQLHDHEIIIQLEGNLFLFV